MNYLKTKSIVYDDDNDDGEIIDEELKIDVTHSTSLAITILFIIALILKSYQL